MHIYVQLIILFRKHNLAKKERIEIAKKANIYDFINSLPNRLG